MYLVNAHVDAVLKHRVLEGAFLIGLVGRRRLRRGGFGVGYEGVGAFQVGVVDSGGSGKRRGDERIEMRGFRVRV